MATWSEHWKLPKGQREEALKAARFTPATSRAKRAKGNPSQQPYNPKEK